VCLVITIAMILGILIGYCVLMRHQLYKRKEAMLQKEEAEARIRGLDTKQYGKQRHPVLKVGEPGMNMIMQARQNMEPAGGAMQYRAQMEPQVIPRPRPNYGSQPESQVISRPAPKSQVISRPQPNYGSQANYGTMPESEGVDREIRTQIKVPRGKFGAPGTVMDGGATLRMLDSNMDGQLDNFEVQSKLGVDSEVVGAAEFETRNSRAGCTSTMVRSVGALKPSMLLSNQGAPRSSSLGPASRTLPRSGSVGAASRPPATASCGYGQSPPISSVNLPATSAGSLGGNGWYGPASTRQLTRDRVQRADSLYDPPLLPINTASSMQSQYPPASYMQLDLVPPSGVMGMR